MNVSQSLAFQALSNVCISRRFSSTPIPKIHLVNYGLGTGSTIMIILRVPLLSHTCMFTREFFHISCHLLLNHSHRLTHLHAGSDGQGGHVVLELQQGHGTRCKQSPWLGRWMGHYRLQGLQSNTSRAAMERWDDTRFS